MGRPPGSNGVEQAGIFSSCKKIGSKASAKIKETTFELAFTSADIGEIQVLLTGPKGLIEVSDRLDSPVPPSPGPSTAFGPATFKDDAALDIDDTAQHGRRAGLRDRGREAFAPYVGEFRPESGLLSSLGSRTGGTWCVVAIDTRRTGGRRPRRPERDRHDHRGEAQVQDEGLGPASGTKR